MTVAVAGSVRVLTAPWCNSRAVHDPSGVVYSRDRVAQPCGTREWRVDARARNSQRDDKMNVNDRYRRTKFSSVDVRQMRTEELPQSRSHALLERRSMIAARRQSDRHAIRTHKMAIVAPIKAGAGARLYAPTTWNAPTTCQLPGRLEELGAEVDAVLAAASELEAAAAAPAYYLPRGYDLKQAAAALAGVRASAAAARAALAPRRNFAFSRRAAPGAAAAAAEAAGGQRLADQAVAPARGQRGRGGGLRGLRHLPIGDLYALRAARLAHCRLFAGPVAGAAFVDGAEGCTLALAARQVRIHSAAGCDVYLRTRSRPIIEGCARLRFAPLTADDLATLGLSAGAAATGLGGAGGGAPGGGGGGAAAAAAEGELWRAVNDFGWVKAPPSPHWAVLPEGERAPAPAPPAGGGGGGSGGEEGGSGECGGGDGEGDSDGEGGGGGGECGGGSGGAQVERHGGGEGSGAD
ncbi:MAG: tubulin binding cofactor C-domain-containing protein [Monoraphidium minutum]|nr:MAG: tubulin binding cofactor C-domain-containing protein [Monoraphidium minutum]